MGQNRSWMALLACWGLASANQGEGSVPPAQLDLAFQEEGEVLSGSGHHWWVLQQSPGELGWCWVPG